MKNKLTRFWAPLLFAAFMLMAASSVGNASAAIIVQFEEIGGNVVATTTGSLLVPSAYEGGAYPGTTRGGGETKLWNFPEGSFALYWGGGSATSSGLAEGPTEAIGDTFGYADDTLYLDLEVELGGTYAPKTTWTWSGNTLTNLNLGYLTTTPFQVYERDGQTISFALVPEPFTIAYLIGAVAFAALRRTRR